MIKKLTIIIMAVMLISTVTAKETRLSMGTITKSEFEVMCQEWTQQYGQPQIRDYTERFQIIEQFRNIKDDKWHYVIGTDEAGDYYLNIIYLYARTGTDKATKQPIYTMRKLTWKQYSPELAARNARNLIVINNTVNNLANDWGKVANAYRGGN